MEAPVKVIHRDLKSRNGKAAKHWNALHLLLPVNVAFKSVPELCERAELTNALVVIKTAHFVAQKSLFPPPHPEPVWSSLQTWHHLEHCGRLFQPVSCWPWFAIKTDEAFRYCLGTSHFFFLFGKVEYQERLADTSDWIRPIISCQKILSLLWPFLRSDRYSGFWVMHIQYGVCT